MINGLFETHIPVSDFGRSRHFYEKLLGLAAAWINEDQRRVLYWVGSPRKTMLGVREIAKDKVSWQHIAFEIAVEDMKNAMSFLQDKGIKCHNLVDKRPFPQVFGWMPAAALFFDDPDGHLIEFIAMLPDKPRPEIGSVSWDEWNRINKVNP